MSMFMYIDPRIMIILMVIRECHWLADCSLRWSLKSCIAELLVLFELTLAGLRIVCYANTVLNARNNAATLVCIDSISGIEVIKAEFRNYVSLL